MNQLRILILILSTSPLLLAQGTALPPQMEAVTIYRDADNWAHVFSTSEIAAYYGFGLAQMRDLPLTTARIFALASGELALHVGPGPAIQGKPNFHVGIDLRTRLWRIAEIANIQKANLPVDIRRLLAAYVAGINEGRLEWLAQAPQLVFNTEPLAYDLATVQRLLSRPVTLDDVLRHGVQINGLTAMNVADAMAESDDPGVKEDPLRTASNSFAVGVQASLENGPMTIADPHLAFEDLGQLRTYFAQISGGGASVAGISFPGFPAIAMGFNDKLSWAITSNNPDFVDVWKTSTAGPPRTCSARSRW